MPRDSMERRYEKQMCPVTNAIPVKRELDTEYLLPSERERERGRRNSWCID